jgi:hypothetical protein
MPAGVNPKERKITIKNQNKEVRNSTTESLKAEKSVTTKTYKYDSKKRVKSVATTVVNTSDSTRIRYNYKEDTYYPDGKKDTESKDNYTKYVDSSTKTTNYTETYAYKKGLAKKYTYSDKGIENRKTISTSGLPNYTQKYADGSTKKVTGSGADWASATTTTVANGTKTTRYEEKAYKVTEVVDGSTSTYDVTADPVTTKTSAVKATPSNKTETYKYDKQKNLASYKYSGSNVENVYQQNETFGNTIYEGYTADQELKPVEVSIAHTYSGSGKNENAVKKGTTALKKTLTMISGKKSDRTTTPGYDCKRVTYTLKAKSFSKKLKTDVEAQQWSIQNGPLNGFVGLSLGY